MPSQKDFKRVVRARMVKTGESYTAARAQVLRKQPEASPVPEPQARPKPSAPPDFATLAGMSDEAVKAKTGCTWERWVWALDKVKANQWPHREIADYVHEKYKVPGWWAQTVTVGYERIKGIRAVGQRRTGGYEATKSKTFPVSMSKLYRAFSDKKSRARWLDSADLVVRKATPNKSMRITWPDGTSVELWFTAKGRSKTQVAVQCTKLPGKDVAAEKKKFWEERLATLSDLLAARNGRSG